MFKRVLIVGILLWCFFAFLFFLGLNTETEENRDFYQRLISANSQTKGKDQEKMRPIQQEREDVMKQLLYRKNSLQTESRLMSDHSTLSFYCKTPKESCVEHLQRIKGRIQETPAPFLDIQDHTLHKECLTSLYCFEAKEAVYFSQDQQLEAEDVSFEQGLASLNTWNRLPSHPLLIKGKANHITYTLQDIMNPQVETPLHSTESRVNDD